MITPGQIKERFPVGDRIEYQTGRGKFIGVIVGYETCEYGVSLNLGDRKFPIWSVESFKMAESFHNSKLSVPEAYGQLTMFDELTFTPCTGTTESPNEVAAVSYLPPQGD